MGDGYLHCDEHGGFLSYCFRCVDEARSESYGEGAAVAFGLMGMAESIGARAAFCAICGDFILDCECPPRWGSQQEPDERGEERKESNG